MGFNIGHPEAGPAPIRLMTYNIKAHLARYVSGGFDGIIAEIRQYDPDIIVMQDARIPGLEWHPDTPLLRRLVGSRSVYAFDQYIVASRLPLHDCETGSIAYDKRPRPFVRCIVTAHGRDIDLYTAHLLSPREGLNAVRRNGIDGEDDWQDNAQDRMAQAAILAQVMAKHSRPAILAGDLNAPESSLVIRTLLNIRLRDAFTSAGWGYGYTHGHSHRPYLFSTIRIDHILVSEEFGIADSFVGGKEGSQHRPVVADIWLR
jgi:endonuclease/exonuclease/phosphatase (EEP) superfamily protein YafD